MQMISTRASRGYKTASAAKSVCTAMTKSPDASYSVIFNNGFWYVMETYDEDARYERLVAEGWIK